MSVSTRLQQCLQDRTSLQARTAIRMPSSQGTPCDRQAVGRGEGRAELEHGVRRVSSEWRQCGSSDRTRARGTESLGADLKERVRQAGAVLVEVVVDVGSVLARRVRVRGRSFPPEFRFDPGRALTVLQDVYNAIPLSPLRTRLLRAASASGTPPSRPQHRSPQRRAHALPQAGPGVDVRRAGGVHPHRRRTSAPGDCGWGVRPQVPGPTAQTAPGVPVPDCTGAVVDRHWCSRTRAWRCRGRRFHFGAPRGCDGGCCAPAACSRPRGRDARAAARQRHRRACRCSGSWLQWGTRAHHRGTSAPW